MFALSKISSSIFLASATAVSVAVFGDGLVVGGVEVLAVGIVGSATALGGPSVVGGPTAERSGSRAARVGSVVALLTGADTGGSASRARLATGSGLALPVAVGFADPELPLPLATAGPVTEPVEGGLKTVLCSGGTCSSAGPRCPSKSM